MKKQSSRRLPRVVARKSRIHGKGLFANQRIAEGRYVIQYKGEKISAEEGTRRSAAHDLLTYVFSLNDRYDIDGASNGNEARFANHSCESNCYVDTIRDEIWIIAARDIKKGEEITYDYSLDADEIMKCACGSDACRGYLNDPQHKTAKRWVRLQKEKALRRKKKK